MRLKIEIDGPIEIEAPGLTGALHRIAAALEPKPRRFLRIAGIMEIPRKKGPTMIATGNHFFDKVLLRLQLAPDGALDGPPTWACDNPAVTLAPTPDGLTCDCSADGDIPSDATVTVTAPVDVPSTPDLETISETFTMTFSHSKAGSLGGTFTEVPKP